MGNLNRIFLEFLPQKIYLCSQNFSENLTVYIEINFENQQSFYADPKDMFFTNLII